ncbi:MAG: ABC transporter permease subunit [Gammaproteobacteria bacterium]|nr:ABC transporter permease subunit [Gammaproteobacteria bacterium]
MSTDTKEHDARLERAFANQARKRWRRIKDLLARNAIGFGGVAVILAIVLIFFYLLLIVFPLFQPAKLESGRTFTAPAGTPLLLAMEEQREVGMLATAGGEVEFFRIRDGSPIARIAVELPATPTGFGAGEDRTGIFGYGLANGQAIVVRHRYQVTFPNDKRLISPVLEYPLGEEPVEVDPQSDALRLLTLQVAEDTAAIAAITDDGRLVLANLEKQESLLGGGGWNLSSRELLPPQGDIAFLLMDKDQRELYAVTRDGHINYYDISNPADPKRVETVRALPEGSEISALHFLTGGISLLVGGTDGSIAQWFPVRDDNNEYSLKRVRGFDPLPGAVQAFAPEYNRKGFLAADDQGNLGIYHSTAGRTVLVRKVANSGISQLGVAPRADAYLALSADGLRFQRIHNEHPEISWSSLWGKVWYESHAEPEYLWQSSSADNDFEPKFSLTPLTFGTLKAAFFAMLFAVPLAIMGAIYTAYFMAPPMRQVVKPVIEIMEALPTVILGFLAGLWLAPFAEVYLPGVVMLLLALPLGVLVAAWLWRFLPGSLRRHIPDGWQAALLIPVLCLIGWGAIALSQPVELWFFGGDIRKWLTAEMGISYDQRNALVVGLAMGFAVIPTIFSIAEDAIFGVPSHLTQGSLALGATPWQTLARVVILTASPGIFSAVMIGLGRAVGETMIVLMATGNTPVMDFSIFQGMRTLSANIAVEMPESEVASTHYRILFLAGLVLFMATFVFNTLAEVVRQRLRVKYSSL